MERASVFIDDNRFWCEIPVMTSNRSSGLIVREWLANGVMPRNTPIRAAAANALPACEVFLGFAPSLQFDPGPEVIGSPNAPREEPMLESGNCAWGFILSTVCSLPALALIVWASQHIGPKTVRGMWWGLATPLFAAIMGVVMFATRAIVTGK